MQRPRFFPNLRVLAIAALVPIFMSPATADTTCTKENGGCQAVTTFSVHTGEPTVICPNGHPVVQIDSSAQCDSELLDGSALLLRCGVSSSPFSYTGWTFVHSFGTKSNWENVLYGSCSHLSYTATPW